MSAEEPLHVRVARALGFTVRDGRRMCRQQCVGQYPTEGGLPPMPRAGEPHFHGGWEEWLQIDEADGEWEPIPPYGQDSQDGYAATGRALLEAIVRTRGGVVVKLHDEGGFIAFTQDGIRRAGRSTPEAVALLFLALAEK